MIIMGKRMNWIGKFNVCIGTAIVESDKNYQEGTPRKEIYTIIESCKLKIEQQKKKYYKQKYKKRRE